jgi:two-component system LytT family sensor kinase
MRTFSWRKIILYIGIWLLIAIFFSVLVYFSQAQLRSDYVFSWKLVFLWQAIIYGWAILFPAISWFAVRFRVERGNWRRTLPIHLIAAVLFVLAHTFLYAVFYHLSNCFYSGEDCLFLEALRRFFFSNWLLDSSMYFLILSAVTAHDYSRRFQAEQLISSELNAALADSKLSALKMQIHPHFLFNTLNSISTLMHEDLRAADEMVARLGDFLRLTLENSGEQVVTLAQEMNFINCYLEIESVRFADRLKLERDVEPNTLQARVPNLILQPLIENAIKHGISRQIRPGKICIRARRSGEMLLLQVEDNGPGPQKQSTDSTGIGLANTRARLFNLYGENQQIEISNADPQGLIVTLKIPFETNGKTIGK